MFSWLMAVISPQLKQVEAPGTNPLDLTSADLSMFGDGTNCGDLSTAEITVVYTGTGTVTIEVNNNGRGLVTYATGVSISAFPYIITTEGYFNSGEPLYTLRVRLTNENNGADTVLTPQRSTTLFDCGA